MEEETFVIVMEGGSPWGFGIQGGLDFRSPLRVKMVTPGGRASKGGLVPGDFIVAINDQETKNLKHMQAQQLIKKSSQRVELKCVKVHLGLKSPSVGQSPSFKFPGAVANGNATRTTPVKSPVHNSKPISRPPPPPVANGHARQSSLGTTGSTTSSSPQSCGHGDTYEAKYLGMDCFCVDKSQPSPESDTNQCMDKSHPMPESDNVQEQVEAVQIQEEVPLTYDFPPEGKSPQEVVQEEMIVEVSNEVHSSYDVGHVEVEQDGEEPDNQDVQEDVTMETSEEPPISEAMEVVELTQKEVDIACSVDEGKIPNDEGNSPIAEPAEAVVMQDVQVELKCDTEETSTEVGVASQPSPKASPPMTKMDLVSSITSAAQRKRRESSTDSEDLSKVQSSPDRSPQIVQKQSSPKPQSPKTSQPPVKQVMSASKPPKPVRTVSIETKEEVLPVAKQPLKQKENSVATGTKEPGWYKQMFQDFQNTVEECFPGAAISESEYVYDDRGLKVRRDSLTKITPEEAPKRETAPSPDDPVYVYDERGLRVRADSLSKVQRSISPEAERVRNEQRPKSATTPKMSVDSGVSTDDVLSANKKQTSYKAHQYSTEGSRDYWKQKDQDHQEFETKRRLSQEQLHIRQSSSDYTSKMASMHPLLQADTTNSQEKTTVSTEAEPESVFNRIDAGKLQGALENASMLGRLEQEGVASELLPGVAKEAQSEKNKPKEKQLKPPPGRKGKALYNFDAQSAKELSFKKGDIIDLLHTVDDNWLQGSVDGAKGIFPTAYVQVLSLDEYRAMLSPEPKPRPEIGRAKAIYDFQGQTEKELSFSKDDELIIKRKIDDNWFEGYHGDKEGIFPVVYVQVL